MYSGSNFSELETKTTLREVGLEDGVSTVVGLTEYLHFLL